MIDKNARLFGKFNILDLLIVFIVVAGVLFFFTRGEGVIIIGPAVETQTHIIRFNVQQLEDFTGENINLGDDVVAVGTEIALGTVVDIDIRPGVDYRPNQDGILVGSYLPGTVDVDIESHIDLPIGSINNGLNIGGNRFAIGQTFPIRFGNSQIFLRISYLGVAE